MTTNINFSLKGLDCANCANKIEKSLNNINGVTEAVVIFVKEEIRIKYDNTVTREEIINLVKDDVTRIEPHVEVTISEDFIINSEEITDEKEENQLNSKLFIDKYFTFINQNRILVFLAGVFVFSLALITKNTNLNLTLFIIAYIILGGDVVTRAIKNILRGDLFDENFLMSVSTIGAFFIGAYAEAVAVMIFYQIGEYLSDLAVDKSRKSIKDLMNIQPEYANIEINGKISQVSPKSIKIGDIIVIKPGERIPLDGVIVEGNTQIDASSLIGESIPLVVAESDNVLSGSINLVGLIKVVVTSDYKNSTVARIMDMVENASAKKSTAEKFITKFSRVYTPIVVLAAVLISVIPPIITGDNFSSWLSRGLMFLVISCPCALVISVPLTFFSGIGTASKKGILVKGGNYLQLLSQINTVVFDKTGTLTKGVFDVMNIIPNESVSKSEVLEYACALEKYSNHPIGKSIIKEYKKINTQSILTVTNHKEIGGMGLIGYIDNNKIIVGNDKIMKEEQVSFIPYNGMGTVVYVAKNKTFLGSIVISDMVKEDSKKAIEKLRTLGIKNIVMLTGDRKKSALETADYIGINKVYYELLPNDKMEKLEEIYRENPTSKVIFVGDGINDAPVLTLADVGIAMGGVGSEAAIEAADVVLMTDEPMKVAEAIQVGRNTVSIATQNIIFALSVKGIFLILGGLGLITMWLAVFADVGVTLLAVFNSMRKK